MSFGQLHLAALQGNTENLHFHQGFLENSNGEKEDVNAKDITGSSPLHKAAKHGHAAFVSLLIEKARPPTLRPRNSKSDCRLIVHTALR